MCIRDRVRSGLRDALDTLEGVPGIAVNRFESRDVVRHPLVARIVDAYDRREAARKNGPARQYETDHFIENDDDAGPSA